MYISLFKLKSFWIGMNLAFIVLGLIYFIWSLFDQKIPRIATTISFFSIVFFVINLICLAFNEDL